LYFSQLLELLSSSFKYIWLGSHMCW